MHLLHLGGLALSGAVLLFIEATAVEPDGRFTPGCLGLWDGATEAALNPHWLLARIPKSPWQSSWRMPGARGPVVCPGRVASRYRFRTAG